MFRRSLVLKAGSDIGENAQKLGLIVYGEHGVAFTKVRVKRNMLELVQRRIDSNNLTGSWAAMNPYFGAMLSFVRSRLCSIKGLKLLWTVIA